MIRRTAAILIALVSLVALAACSSSDSAKKVEPASTATTADDETTTTDEETTTTQDEGLKSKIDLGGLASASSDPIADDVETCLEDGIQADPYLSSYTSFEEIQAGPQADLEAFYLIYISCAGPEVVIDQFMEGVASDGTLDSSQLACVRTVAETMTAEEGAALIAGDETITATFQAAIAPCVV